LLAEWSFDCHAQKTMCRDMGIQPPAFEEIGPAVLVTFHVSVDFTRTSPRKSPARSEHRGPNYLDLHVLTATSVI
jgi:hypothetical protein